MSVSSEKIQPGAILHQVITGCLRAAGTNFDAWCQDNGVNASTAKQATYGQSGGDKGKALLNRMIDAAGREQVEMSYSSRIQRHAAEIAAEKAA